MAEGKLGMGKGSYDGCDYLLKNVMLCLVWLWYDYDDNNYDDKEDEDEDNDERARKKSCHNVRFLRSRDLSTVRSVYMYFYSVLCYDSVLRYESGMWAKTCSEYIRASKAKELIDGGFSTDKFLFTTVATHRKGLSVSFKN